LPSFRIFFVKTNQECDRICVRNDHPSFQNSGFTSNQEPLSVIALFPDVKHLCIPHDNTCGQLLLAVEVVQRAEGECFCHRCLPTKNSSRSGLFNINSSSAGLRALIRDCMNLPVLQMNLLSELVLIEPPNSHVLTGVRWHAPVVTSLSDCSSALR
jgi:hypothetical protein